MEQPIHNMELRTIATDLDEKQLVGNLTEQFKAIPKEGVKVISLVAGPASGKGTLATMIKEALGNAAVLSTDNYLKGDRKYRRTNIEDPGKDPIEKYDFAFLKQQVEVITKLKDDDTVGIPEYDGVSGVAIGADPDNPPDPNTYLKKVGKVNYLIIEGDFQPFDRNQIDCLVYLDVPDEIRLANRVYRDLQKRGESDEQPIIDNFNSRQKTQFIPHTLPNRELADMVIEVNATLLAVPTSNRKFDYRFNILKRD